MKTDSSPITKVPIGRIIAVKLALVKLFDDILWSMEKQKINLLVAVDLAAAFDTVDHGILIDVL